MTTFQRKCQLLDSRMVGVSERILWREEVRGEVRAESAVSSSATTSEQFVPASGGQGGASPRGAGPKPHRASKGSDCTSTTHSL